MAEVSPFRGIRYNPESIKTLGDVVCPPFDTIPPDLQQDLYQRSPHNVIRLEAGERHPDDTSVDNRYTRSGGLLTDWLTQGILQRDSAPSMYLVEHTFSIAGQDRSRLEIIASVRLEDYDRKIVLPHEYTRDADKEDRLALMQACRTNFSPLMLLYSDRSQAIRAVLDDIIDVPPAASLLDQGQQSYKVWTVEDDTLVGRIRDLMSSEPLYIADGHHRYETALTYRDLEREKTGGQLFDDAACNHVMAGLIAFDDPGLVVLPYHRILKNLSPSSLAQVRYELWKYFNAVTDVPGAAADLSSMLANVEELGNDAPVMGMMDPGGRGSQVLRLRRGVDLKSWGTIAASEAWILEEQILRPILGKSTSQCIDYVHDAEEAAAGVENGDFQIAFFLKPFPLDLFKEIMDDGQKLPPKSTFFYPKLPAGLVLNPLDGNI